MTDHGFGRLPAADERDAQFPVARLLAAEAAPPPSSRYWWASGWWGDQGPTPQCVGYSWSHWLADGPVTQGRLEPAPTALYDACQLVDEWPGEGYDGTSVRAGAKVLQQRGLVGSYWWAVNADEVATAVLALGPVVVGTTWLSGMMAPDEQGRIRATGRPVGGHAYLLNGYNSRTRLFRIKNSWGRGWGDRGHARIHLDGLGLLLADDGEACVAVERRAA